MYSISRKNTLRGQHFRRTCEETHTCFFFFPHSNKSILGGFFKRRKTVLWIKLSLETVVTFHTWIAREKFPSFISPLFLFSFFFFFLYQNAKTYFQYLLKSWAGIRVVRAINVFEKFINVCKSCVACVRLINPRSNFSPVTFFFFFFFYLSWDKKYICYISSRGRWIFSRPKAKGRKSRCKLKRFKRAIVHYITRWRLTPARWRNPNSITPIPGLWFMVSQIKIVSGLTGTAVGCARSEIFRNIGVPRSLVALTL